MARTVADLTFQTQTMLDLAARTPDAFDGEQIMTQPWKAVDLPKKMRIGWYTEGAGVKVDLQPESKR